MKQTHESSRLSIRTTAQTYLAQKAENLIGMGKRNDAFPLLEKALEKFVAFSRIDFVSM